MPEQTDQHNPERHKGASRPLQIPGRFREVEVEAQIVALQRFTSREILRLAKPTDPNHKDYIHPETLVYLLRDYHRKGDSDAAWALAELLLQRNTRFIAQHIAVWKLPSISMVDECIQDVQMRVVQDLVDLSSGSEFWEVRYWVCLKRRILNIVQKYRAVADMEFHPEQVQDGEGNVSEFFDRVAAPETVSPPLRAQIGDALERIPDRERTAFVLYYYEGWTQDHIAVQLQVTERTVRNMLARAEKTLATWRNESIQ